MFVNNKISKSSPKVKSKKLFVYSVINFNQSLYRDEPVSKLIDQILDVYLFLPGVNSVSLFFLNMETFEFHPGNEIGGFKINHQDVFNFFVTNGTIAETLDKGKITFSQTENNLSVIIIPVISPDGIMGLVQLIGNKTLSSFPACTRNYCFLHANQLAFLLANAKLRKEINNLENEVEQKISLRVEKIKQAQRELQFILDSILTGVFIIEKSTGTIINVNEAALEILHADRNSIVGTKRNEWEYFENLLSGKKFNANDKQSEETYLLNSERKPIPVIRTISNLFIGNKEIRLESFIDISIRKKYENELNRQKDLLKGTAEATNVLLLESSFKSSINKAIEYLGTAAGVERVYIFRNVFDENLKALTAKREFKWRRENSHPFNSSFDAISYENELNEWFQYLSNQKSVYGVVRKIDAKIKNFLKELGIKSFLLAPIYVENKFWGFIVFDDCTSEKEWTDAEEAIIKSSAASIGGAIQRNENKLQLINAIERAENADRSDKLKSEFLAQMSHEIRTPINSILGFTSILKQEFEDKLTDDLKTTFNVISNAGLRIIRTIDLILNMSELQTGIYQYEAAEFDVHADVLIPLHEEFLRRAKQKNIKMNINNECGSAIVKADRYSVEQIFNNLLDNAVKYTEKGSIEINFKRNVNSALVVEVRDTGIGISTNYMPKIFEPFTQEDQGYTRKYEGNGLGLAVVKKYCDLNNIAIQIESRKGIGSKFTITFPV
ncbi:MAG: GAF domain-containing protein [Melioribacteraceae bacterium]|nr:MAG: GAF domain-containing protein [Melioribacteraceae bacterium]